MSCHQLFVLLCHSQQAVPALPQQLHSQRRLPGTRHARFLHSSSQTSSERAQELPTVPIFVTEKVHVGIERNRAIPTKWRTGSSRRCVGGSRHMVDWGEPQASPTVTCSLGFLSRYIDRPTSVFDPAPGVKVGCCGPNLRVVTLCENDLLYWYMHVPSHSSSNSPLIELVRV